MKKELIEKLEAALKEEKQSVQKELEAFAIKDNVPKGDWETKFPAMPEADKEEQEEEVEEYNNRLPVEHSLELKLRDINFALEKVKNGTYGICEKCGKEISEERLLAIPEARTCLNCGKK